MHRTLRAFEAHLSLSRPAFHCFACGARSEKPTFVARVKNQIGKPATKAALALLNQLLGPNANQMADFYRLHNGVTLYRDILSEDAGVRLFPVSKWKSASNELRASFSDMKPLYGRLVEGIAIGDVYQSANFFVYQPDHSIHYLMFDPAYDKAPRFASLAILLGTVLRDPAQFLNALGCYTRFSDGKTDKQWIPKAFLQNAPRS